MYRCPSCNEALVTSEGEVCSECKAFCPECLNERPSLVKVFTKRRKEFYHAYKDQCGSCKTIDWLNSEGLCRECDPPKEELLEKLMCPDCAQKQKIYCTNCGKHVSKVDNLGECVDCRLARNFNERESLRLTNCVECGRNTMAVNKLGVCKSCVVNSFAAKAKAKGSVLTKCAVCGTWLEGKDTVCKECEKDMRKCEECEKPFYGQVPEQYLCEKHLPSCESCRKQFIPLLRTDRHCTSCMVKLRSTETWCSGCGIRPAIKGGDNLCPDCKAKNMGDWESEDYHTMYPCQRCKESAVDTPKGICNDCKLSKHLCKGCLQNYINAEDTYCEKCLNK